MSGQSNSTIDAIGGLDYSFRTIRYAGDDPFVGTALTSYRKIDEKPKFTYRAGFNYNHRFFRNLWLKTGVRYASVGYYLKKDEQLIWESEIVSGVYDPTLPHRLTFSQYFQFIEVPLGARLEIPAGKWSFFVEGGAGFNFYLNTRSVIKLDNDTKTSTVQTSHINRVSTALYGSVGVQYQVSNRYSIFAQPIFRYHLTRLTYDLVTEHLYNTGLEAGIRLRL